MSSGSSKSGGRRNSAAPKKAAPVAANVAPPATAAVQATPTPPTPPVAPAPVPPAPTQNPSGPVTFSAFTDADAQALRTSADAYYDADVTDAIKLYISDSNPNGDGFSHSQNLNYKLDSGAKLNPTEQFIDDNIQYGMHQLGKNSQLTRFCHDDILQQAGIADYTKLTQSQLKKQLIGREFVTKSYNSYSYDTSKNPFRVGAAMGGGREVTIKTNAKADTKVVFGAKKQAELVVNKGTKQKITDVYFDGTMATPRGGRMKPRIVIVTETV